jgi:CRP-like cAMP-binding protein
MLKQTEIFSCGELELYYSDLISAVNSFVPLDKADILRIKGLFLPVRVEKSKFFIEIGEVSSSIGFICRGLFRFYQMKDSIEITSDFAFEKSFITSYTSLITREPSKVAVQALENSVMLAISYEKLIEYYNEKQKYERIGRLLAEQAFMQNERHLLSFLSDSAEERYKNLIDTAPHFIQKIPLVHIASYLGIKPETLSRIRKKI